MCSTHRHTLRPARRSSKGVTMSLLVLLALSLSMTSAGAALRTVATAPLTVSEMQARVDMIEREIKKKLAVDANPALAEDVCGCFKDEAYRCTPSGNSIKPDPERPGGIIFVATYERDHVNEVMVNAFYTCVRDRYEMFPHHAPSPAASDASVDPTPDAAASTSTTRKLARRQTAKAIVRRVSNRKQQPLPAPAGDGAPTAGADALRPAGKMYYEVTTTRFLCYGGYCCPFRLVAGEGQCERVLCGNYRIDWARKCR